MIELAGLRKKTALHQFGRQIQRFVHLVLVVLAKGVVKLFREERFRRFGLLGDTTHFVDQICRAAFLPGQSIGQFLPLVGIAQCLARGIGHFTEFFRQLLLFLRKLPRVVAHLAHFIGELTGAFPAEIVAELLQVALGARAGGEGLRDGIVVQCFRRALHFRAGFIELLARLGHPRLVFRSVHPLVQFINVRQHLPLFFAQAPEPATDIGPGLLQRGLQFFDALVEVLLALRQFFQTAQHLKLFVLPGVLRRRCLALGFVTVFRLFQVQLVELPHGALTLLSALLTVAAARNAIFTRGKF